MDVVIRKGALAGKGVFADRDFSKGEVVIKYRLKHLTMEESTKLQKNEKEFIHSHHGVMYLYSIPERYVNHSERPNTYQDLERKADVALRDIKKGEMVTTDSSKDDV